MNKAAMITLEYPEIILQLTDMALSESGKTLCQALLPETDEGIVNHWLLETTETRNLLQKGGVPLSNLNGMEKVMEKLGKTTNLTPEELSMLRGMNKNVGRMMRFMTDRLSLAPTVATYAASMDELKVLSEEIDRCILDNRIDDKASPELSRLRKKIAILSERIRSKLDSLMNAPGTRDLLQDAVVGMRDNHYVLPVKREHRQKMDGQVLDISSSGSTVFIEPAAIRSLKVELDVHRLEEEQEVYRILSVLTALAASVKKELRINLETMANYDFLFSKAKLANEMHAVCPSMSFRKKTVIVNGRHPLLGEEAVPLNFHIGDGYRALIITGPNTGGKTVVLKTVGLFTLMAQAGLHIPADAGTQLAVYDNVLADIGDGQSIAQSLSTFSSHIKNIIAILTCADSRSLVIIDELGTGTDPGEGMGLAVAVMEALYQKGVTLLATTHYSEIKDFAATTAGFKNGCMGFNVETLQPRYELSIGIPGESNAFLISYRLGMPVKLVERAHQITYRAPFVAPKISTASKSMENTQTSVHAIQEEIPESLQVQREHQQSRHKARKMLEKEKQRQTSPYKTGDSVFVTSMNRTGIVCEMENLRGEIGVMIMRKKWMVNHTRLRPFIDGKDLYPEDYNLDVVLESVENRKKRHQMGKHHVEGLEIVIEATPKK